MRVLDREGLKAKGINYTPVHLLRMERAGKFPKHIMLGENRSAWIEAEIDAWPCCAPCGGQTGEGRPMSASRYR
jgi:prophage regulatory protein